MKRIEAIIKPFKIDDVTEALQELGVGGITAIEVRGFGRHNPNFEQYGGKEAAAELLPRLKIEVIAADGDVEKIVSAIEKAANTGREGDGKIFVIPVEEVVRIRTGERGKKAL